MKKLALVSRKGGSGKSTLAVHLAVCAIESGLFVVLVDLDPQGSATAWFEMRGNSKELVTVQAKQEDLPVLLQRAKENGADLIIIDTAPHTDISALAAADCADFILVPCKPSTFDLKALPATFELLNHSKSEAQIILNFAPPVGHLAEETANQLRAAGYPVCPVIIGQRVSFAHSVADGRAVNEYEPNGKAAAEINALWATIQEKLNNEPNR